MKNYLQLEPSMYNRRDSKSNILVGIAVVVLLTMLIWQVAIWTKKASLDRLRQKARDNLKRYSNSLQNELKKYEHIPELLTVHNNMAHGLLNPKNNRQVDKANRYLEKIKKITGAANIFVMDTKGLVVAGSNWNTSRPSIGNNYGFRPYFEEAMQGCLGRYFALGIHSEKCGYFFAYPIKHNAKILGVVMLKIDLPSNNIKASWGGGPDHFIVTDLDGVIFLSTKAEWQYNTLYPLSQKIITKIKTDQRYPLKKLQQWPVVSEKRINDHDLLLKMRVRDPSTTNNFRKIDYIMLGTDVDEVHWRVHILCNLAPVREHVYKTVLLTFFFLIILLLIVLFILERRKTIHMKLSGFKQMTASICHELKNPLTAIQMYNDKAIQYLERSQSDKVHSNLVDTSELLARINQIIQQLQIAFTNTISAQVTPVFIQATIDEVLQTLSPQLTNVQIIHDRPSEEIFALGDMVQIRQIFDNIISNALQAMENSKEHILTIEIGVTQNTVLVIIRDNGTGIPEENLTSIFEPFFTTRVNGQGLGLGLSISYRFIKNLKGNIKATNCPRGGAEFAIELPRAQVQEGANNDGE